MNKNIHAAGILIYSFNMKGNIVFLLGKENKTFDKKSNKYCDFGGGRKKMNQFKRLLFVNLMKNP